jgi:uncharacterized protein YkwD
MKRLFILAFFTVITSLVVAGCSSSRQQAVVAPLSNSVDTSNVIQPTATLLPTDTPTLTPTLAPTPVNLPSPTPTTQAEALPSPTPTEAPSPTPTVSLPNPASDSQSASAQASSASAQACIDKASFSEDVTIPDGTLVKIGETFTKTWKIRNEGTCDWVGYSMIYAGGEAMNSPMSVPLQEIKPGEFADISVQLQAPQRGGGHTGYWEFQNAAGQSFGVGAGADGLIWAQINVDYPTPEAVAQASTSQDTSAQSSNTSQAATTLTSTSQTTASNTTPNGCVYTGSSDYENQIVALVNDARVKNGLAPLTVDSKLSAAALGHSIDMACNDLVSHSGSDGSSWYDRVKAQGFANYTSTRENIYVGNPAFGGDAQGAFTWWMNSKIHHDNILFPTVTSIGVAYAYTANSFYGGYYTLELARK